MSDEKDIVDFLRKGISASLRVVDTMTVEDNGKIYEIRSQGNGYLFSVMNEHGNLEDDVMDDVVNTLREVEQNNQVKEFLVHSLSVSRFTNGESKVVLRFTWIPKSKTYVSKNQKSSKKTSSKNL